MNKTEDKKVKTAIRPLSHPPRDTSHKSGVVCVCVCVGGGGGVRTLCSLCISTENSRRENRAPTFRDNTNARQTVEKKRLVTFLFPVQVRFQRLFRETAPFQSPFTTRMCIRRTYSPPILLSGGKYREKESHK